MRFETFTPRNLCDPLISVSNGPIGEVTDPPQMIGEPPMASVEKMFIEEIKAEIALLALQGDALAAAREWLNRNARKTPPAGRSDGAGRFYPAPDEHHDCCDGIRPPSRAYPYSLWSHVHSATHVAALYNEEPSDVRRAAKLLTRLDESADGSVTAD